jgi:hypothetical protein
MSEVIYEPLVAEGYEWVNAVQDGDYEVFLPFDGQPLATDDGVELSVLNARILDALDEANSSLMKFPGTNRIMRIKKIAFVASKVEGIDLFRLPHRASSTYVSERFVERVKAAGLRGLAFNKVWSG